MVIDNHSAEWGGMRTTQPPLYRAKKCKYKGIEFKSMLEGKIARALDDLGIRWVYEGFTTLDRDYMGGQYTPDFYLPDDFFFIEAVGKMDTRHRHNAELFVRKERCADLRRGGGNPPVSESNPGFVFVTGGDKKSGWIYDHRGDAADLLHCMRCGRWSFVVDCCGWVCAHCGQYIGEGSAEAGDNYWNNIFDAAACAGRRGDGEKAW